MWAIVFAWLVIDVGKILSVIEDGLGEFSSYQLVWISLLPRSLSALVAVWQRTGGAGGPSGMAGPFRPGPQIRAGRSAGQAHRARGREVIPTGPLVL